MDNPLLDAYICEKEQEQKGKIQQWVHVLRVHYDACIVEGFTPKQSMQLVERLWIQVDERDMRRNNQ
jgi:Spy/CpxP family protein refolding chaperone